MLQITPKNLPIWLWLPTKALPPISTTLSLLSSIPNSMLTEEEVEDVTNIEDVMVDGFRITTVVEVMSIILKIPNLGTQTPALIQHVRFVTNLGTQQSTVTKG